MPEKKKLEKLAKNKKFRAVIKAAKKPVNVPIKRVKATLEPVTIEIAGVFEDLKPAPGLGRKPTTTELYGR